MSRNNLSKIFNILLIISCIVHIIFIFYNNSHPAIPEIIIKNKKIIDVDMPLSFIFCLRNINSDLENEKYKKAGYDSIYRFFSGTSMFNESVVGWLGHTENGLTYDSSEGIFNFCYIKVQTSKYLIFRIVFKLKIGGFIFEYSEEDKDCVVR